MDRTSWQDNAARRYVLKKSRLAFPCEWLGVSEALISFY